MTAKKNTAGLLIIGGVEVPVASWSETLRRFIQEGWKVDSSTLLTPGWGYAVGALHFTLWRQGMCAELLAH